MSWAVSGRSGHRTCIPKAPTPAWHTGVLMVYVIRVKEGQSEAVRGLVFWRTTLQATWPLPIRGNKSVFFFFIIIPLSIFLHTDWKVHHLTEASDTHTKQKDAFIYYISLQNTPCLLNWGTVIQSWERTASIMGRHIFTSLTPLHLFLAISVKFGPNPVAFWARKWEDRDISILTRAIQHTHYGRKDLKLISPSTINASFVTSQRETN